MAEWITVGLAVIITGGQVVSIVMHLRTKVAILELRQEILKECDDRYVDKGVCNERHSRPQAAELVRVR